MRHLNTATTDVGPPPTSIAEQRSRIPAGALQLIRATSANAEHTEAWAAAEGWNPGRSDSAVFQRTYPTAQSAGYLGERHVSAISLINYSQDLAFCGGLLVDPNVRSRGIGVATWAAAIGRAGARTVAADVPVHLIDKAEQLGFTSSFRIFRFSGRLPPARPRDPHVRPFKAANHSSQIGALDAACFRASRPGFATGFATADGHHTLVYADANGNVRGYGVLRPARSMARIGPLYAELSYQAAAIFDGLCALADDAGAVAIAMDVPEKSWGGCAIPDVRGLPGSVVAHRMYRVGLGGVPAVDFSQMHALTCLGLG